MNNNKMETETDESSLTNLSTKRRKVANHLGYPRNGLSKISNHLSHSIKRELENSRDTEKSSGTAISPHSNSNDMFINGSGSVDVNQIVRRSTRKKKCVYGNLNQSWMFETRYQDPYYPPERQNSQDGHCGRPQRSERNHNYELRGLGEAADSLEYEDDMYSRVKNKRRKSSVHHNFYARRISQDAGSMGDTEETDHNGISDSETMDDQSDLEREAATEFSTSIAVGESQEDSVVNSSKYSLRPKKPITERFQFPIKTTRPRRSAAASIFVTAQHHQRPRLRESFKTTAHRSHLFRRRKRHAIHSSSSSSSDDERRFEKKKALSMAKARNRCLPLNFIEDDLNKGTLKDRMRIGSSLADIDPMTIDKTVSFDNIGGLDKHIQSLKEMILFPLMYPEVFQRFKITPPRGVLFYGSPGTGKTLVARALANECSTGDKRVAFFMRKGADCLSKWVGESERQLRLLFDQAYSMRPSIVFFDEIDGLAPVRSTRQDQIHSSIVSTLLALMDGLDNRGEIVIIGATNRLDAIDPALRRPGRFDRELFFPLPSFQARQQILKIITQDWIPPLPESLISELAVCTSGYCGADLKALCSEAALVALRRRYPQIYKSKQKLQLDVETIQVQPIDFFNAMKKMKPSVQRSAVFSAKPLSSVVRPLLENMLQHVFKKISKIFPFFENRDKMALVVTNSPKKSVIDADSDDSEECLYQDTYPKLKNLQLEPSKESAFLDAKSHLIRLAPIVHRPYFLLSGKEGQGQGSLAPAVLYFLENISIHRLDIPALYAVTSRAPEEACAQIFHEAQRNLPSVIFLPHIGYWWETLSETVRATFLSLLQDLDPSIPLMLFATSDVTYQELPLKIQEIFGTSPDQVFCMHNPTDEERKTFFSNLVKEIYKFPQKVAHKENVEELPVAPPPVVRKLTVTELNKVRQREEATMRELRLFLRDIITKLARDRRFAVFSRPVDPAEVPDYQEVIRNPMDLETMMTKIDLHRYETVAQFLGDIDLVCQNALEYNPDRDPSDKLIRHRACALKDTAHALVTTELDDEFEKICQEIQKSRKDRGDSPSKFAPKKYQALSKTLSCTNASLAVTNSVKPSEESTYAETKEKPCDRKENSETLSSPTRFSKRIRERTPRYMLWRKRKGPWFGSCRRKLMRRKTKINPRETRSNKLKLHNSNQKFIKTSDPLQPTQEENNPKDESNVNSNLDYIITRSADEKKDSSGTDSSATIVSPKAVSAPTDLLIFSEKRDNLSDNLPEPHKSEKKLSGLSSPTSPSRRHLSCDISVDTNSRHMTLRSPPASSMLRSPPIRKTTVTPEPAIAISMETDIPKHSEEAVSSISPASPQKKIVINTASLERFVSKLVRTTDNFTVEKLLQLYSYLQHCVYKYRKELDKKELLKELESCLDSFLHHSPS